MEAKRTKIVYLTIPVLLVVLVLYIYVFSCLQNINFLCRDVPTYVSTCEHCNNMFWQEKVSTLTSFSS